MCRYTGIYFCVISKSLLKLDYIFAQLVLFNNNNYKHIINKFLTNLFAPKNCDPILVTNITFQLLFAYNNQIK